MHDCKKASDILVDLLFDELPAEQRSAMLLDLASCPACRHRYEEAEKALSVFDCAAKASIPADGFWPSYDNRLRARLNAEPAPLKPPAYRFFNWNNRLARVALAACVGVLLLGVMVRWSWWIAEQPPVASSPVAVDAAPADHQSVIETGSALQPINAGGKVVGAAGRTSPRSRTSLGGAGRGRETTVLAGEDSATAFDPGDSRHLREVIALHVEKAEMLLRSFKNARPAAEEATVELSFERRLAGALLGQNILLRRQAASYRDIGAEELLDRFEPILIDITHLQDASTAGQVRPIKERMEKAFILTGIHLYLAKQTTGAS
jgi:hypothetical protein